MLAELKQKVNEQYDEMYPKTDWKEKIDSILVGAMIVLFAYLYFSIAT